MNPALFVSHGAPSEALVDGPWQQSLRDFAAGLPALRSILVVSAHWQSPGRVFVTSAEKPETIHDFGGFAPELYDIRYPAPGDPGLAQQIVASLTTAGVNAALETRRGLDHGVWSPLLHLVPQPTVPVIQISLPTALLACIELGEALRPWRARGALVLASGGAVHNLYSINFDDPQATITPWADAFDRWLWERVQEDDRSALLAYRTRAPHAMLAHPTDEHLRPALVALGLRGRGDSVRTVFEGFVYGTLSMRTFAVG